MDHDIPPFCLNALSSFKYVSQIHAIKSYKKIVESKDFFPIKLRKPGFHRCIKPSFFVEIVLHKYV